jgi:TonB family protein
MTRNASRIRTALVAASLPAALALAVAPRADAATIALRPLGGSTTTAVSTHCSKADAPAAIDAAFFRMPEIARALQITGESLVRVDLDATGHLRDAAMYRSSGNRWLDEAAIDAAHLSRYRAEVQNCSAVAGSYLVAVQFTEDDLH